MAPLSKALCAGGRMRFLKNICSCKLALRLSCSRGLQLSAACHIVWPVTHYVQKVAAMDTPLSNSQIVVRVCLLGFAAIAVSGGSLQMYLGQPDTSPRLDNVHRFMAGIYLFMGLICAWAAVTVRQQGTLVYLIAAGVFVAGCGRLLSMSKVGLPEPPALWLGYLTPELLLPWVLSAAHFYRPQP